MKRWIDAHGMDPLRHVHAAQRLENGKEPGLRHAGFRGLSRQVHLDEHRHHAAHLDRGPAHPGAQFGGIDRLNPGDRGHRLADLVRLQRADQFEAEGIRGLKQRAEEGLLLLGLLHPVLSEMALPAGVRLLDGLDGMEFADRHQGDGERIAARALSRRGHPSADGGEAGRDGQGQEAVRYFFLRAASRPSAVALF